MTQGAKHSLETRKKMSLDRMKVFNPNWKFGRYVSKQGYVYILSPEHPARINRKKGTRGYVAEHRLVMEAHLGRYLLPTEYVHHRNAVKDDNRIENLEIILRGMAHKGEVNCPFCHKQFSIR